MLSTLAASSNLPHIKATALVLAASRRGPQDSVAKLQNKSHKCFVEVAGEVMLERVIDTLIKSQSFKSIFISIESLELLKSTPRLAQWLAQGAIHFTPSADNLADSVFRAAEQIDAPFPLIITTGDNCTHTAEFTTEFVTRFLSGGKDIAIAMTPEDIVRAEFPNLRLAYHQFKDGGFSNCNLYALRDAQSLAPAELFRGGGQFGKKISRIIKAFGMVNLFIFKSRFYTLNKMINRITGRFGLSADTIKMPYFFGPIDVDNPEFFAAAEQIIYKRIN